MPRTLLTKYSDLLLTIYRLAQEKPVVEFQDALLEALKQYIPFDSSMWGTAVMQNVGIDIHSIHLHQCAPGMISDYEKVKHLDTAAARVTQQEYSTIAFNAATEFAAPHHAEMLQFVEKYKHLNFLITCNINPHTKFTHWLSLYRKDAEHLCKDEEVQLLATLAPHVMQALAINRIIHVDRLAGDVARERWCVAIADTRGVPYHAGHAFWELLDLEWDTGDRDHLPPKLLSSLIENDVFVGSHVVVRRSLEHGLLYLKARRREPVDDLSPREYLVAQLMANGLTHKEVAKKLERSPTTIRTQVRVVFGKLNIKNVVMLPAHLALRD